VIAPPPAVVTAVVIVIDTIIRFPTVTIALSSATIGVMIVVAAGAGATTPGGAVTTLTPARARTARIAASACALLVFRFVEAAGDLFEPVLGDLVDAVHDAAQD